MVTREDVENIALLSKLFVPEEELDGLTKSMQEIIDFADTINNAPTDGEEFDDICQMFFVRMRLLSPTIQRKFFQMLLSRQRITSL